MSRPFIEPDQTTRINELERRLNAIERSPQLGNTTINSGTLAVTDAAGNWLVMLGLLPNGNYGIQVSDAAGYHHLLMDNAGAGLPFCPVPTRNVVTGQGVSSTSFTDVWVGEVELLQWDSVRVRVAWATGASAGQLRISCLTSSTNTATVALPSGSSGTAEFHWLHGQTLGTGPWFFTVQASTAAAINPINVAAPDGGLVFYRGTEMSPLSTVTGI